MKKNIFKEVVDSINVQKKDEKSDSLYHRQISDVEGIYIFVSFDLANSTLFKGRHLNLWPSFLSSFYEVVISEFGIGKYELKDCVNEEYVEKAQRTGGFHLWKLVGDEVLLYHKVVSKDELYDTILTIDRKRAVLIEKTIKKCTKDSENRDSLETLYMQYFDIKTTVWIGSCVENIQNITSYKPNMVFDQLGLNNDQSIASQKLDFLGPDIDEGFRVCGFAEKGKMIVTPKLVYLLMKAYEMEHDNDKLTVLSLNFKIVNYVSMKGIWEQRLYPIIMFCQNRTDAMSAINNWRSQFDYDAFETSKLYENIEKYDEQFLTSEKFSITNLKKIYKDIVREKEMEKMLNDFCEQEEKLKKTKPFTAYMRSDFEFHIACLCYDEEYKKYWLTKHKMHGWSFGCIRIQNNENFLEYVTEMYKKKYDLDVHLDEDSPILSFYTTDRKPYGKGMILGVVLMSTCAKKDCQKEGIQSGWYTYEQIMDGTSLEGEKLKQFDSIIKRANELITK